MEFWRRSCCARWATGLALLAGLLAEPVPAQAQRTGTAAPPPLTITQLGTITDAGNPMTLVGHRAQLRAVPIGQVLNDRVILLGGRSRRQVLVRLPRPIRRLRPGQLLDVVGILDQLPVQPPPWNLSPQATQLVQQQRIFLNATQASRRPSASP